VEDAQVRLAEDAGQVPTESSQMIGPAGRRETGQQPVPPAVWCGSGSRAWAAPWPVLGRFEISWFLEMVYFS